MELLLPLKPLKKPPRDRRKFCLCCLTEAATPGSASSTDDMVEAACLLLLALDDGDDASFRGREIEVSGELAEFNRRCRFATACSGTLARWPGKIEARFIS